MLFHVIWTTFQVWPPADARGDWSDLAQVYADLVQRHGFIRMSHPLDRRWQAVPPGEGAVELTPFARSMVAREIAELAESDRVAGDTQIRALAVLPRAVQIVLACPEDALQQRVGRLKSRSATDLASQPAAGGNRTWSRGFWWARLEDPHVLDEVVAFVAAAAKISP